MNRHIERQKLLNRLAVAENAYDNAVVREMQANKMVIHWRSQLKEIQVLLAADEGKE
jgi:hypothetical protein